MTPRAALAASGAAADPAEIVVAEARPSAATISAGGWTVSVTLRHGDTGWDDYADGWRVVAADGRVVGTRALLHPHVDEQPFTRTLRLPALPGGALFVESSTSVTGWAGPREPLRRAE